MIPDRYSFEKIYSEWNILEKEKYVWKKDNCAKIIYLIAKKY
ncbi:MAG: hypothetical protein ABFQ65_02535 [Nanoarchaeota archaeon]